MKTCSSCGHVYKSPDWICSKCGFVPSQQDGIVLHAPEFAQNGDEVFKSEMFEDFNEWELSSFWWRSRRNLILWLIHKFHGGKSPCSLLEIGCAAGWVLDCITQEYPEIKISGAEIFLNGLRHAAKRLPNADLMQMDARRIPFKEEFDIIGLFDVLEHIKEDENVLSEIYKALKPGGLLFIFVPQHRWLWSPIDDHVCHVRRYTAVELREKLLAKNFRIERSTSFVSFLLPAMAFVRLKTKFLKQKINLESEMRPPKWLNGIFYKIMQFEGKLIQWGFSFPLGGSRLMVARKPKEATP